MSSSSSSSMSQLSKYDVFISFRGADIRTGFLSHLQEALLRNQIHAFVDENLHRGEDIEASLLQVIEQSHVSIVIFSQNYALSPWCLDELVKIIECKKTMGQLVLPVFYNVDPTHVQELTANYGDAIVKHREEFKFCLCKVEKWNLALKESASMAGLVSHQIRRDSKLVDNIIGYILEKLNCVSASDSSDDGFVGIKSRVIDVESRLCLESVDVRVVGIWGMGGIGKTTIAGRVFDRISYQFTSRCFVGDVRGKLEKCTPEYLQNEIIFQLLGKEISNAGIPIIFSGSIRKMLSRRKTLIVLDNVSDLKHVELLVGRTTDYGPGSRIIMTSRDKQLLKYWGAEIYEVEGLNDCEAHSLFRFHAFGQKQLEDGYVALLERAIEYAKGNPLALTVLGSNLYGRTPEEWEDELEKLKVASDEKIMKILRISYDGLSKNEKEIFLDIACFFKGEDKDYVESILGTRGSKIGISRLVDKSLISISYHKLDMHDLLQQMGKDIVCEETQLGKRSRLWNPKDIYHVLTRDKGSEAIQAIALDMSKIRDVELSPVAFERMCNLRLLKFYNPACSEIKIRLPEGLRFLSEELRLLCWHQYPSKSLPSSFCPENLVELHMPNSQLKELWSGVQNLENLKLIDVSRSSELTNIPDLSRARNLDILDLSWCRNLVEIPSSVQFLSKLTELYLSYCESLCSLPSFFHLESLEFLSLCGCSKITEFPDVQYCVRELLIHDTGIQELPTSFGYLSQLSQLYLGWSPKTHHSSGTTRRLNHYIMLPHFSFPSSRYSKPATNGSRIKVLPDSICNLKYLTCLDVSKCLNLHVLPENLGNLESLKELIARGSGIRGLPDTVCNLKGLINLDVSYCEHLCRLPENLGNLESLEQLIAFGSGLIEVPSTINRLRTLQELDFDLCEGLLCHRKTGGFFCLQGLRVNFCGIIDALKGFISFTSSNGPYIGGKNLKSILESNGRRSSMAIELDLPLMYEIFTTNCTPLKSAFRSIQLLEELRGYVRREFVNCINSDQDEYNKIMDHLLAIKAPWQGIEHWLRLCIPTSEVPRKMTHQNENGFSLSIPLIQLEQMECSSLYLSAVYNLKMTPGCFVGCKCYFSSDFGCSSEGPCFYWIEGDFHSDVHYEFEMTKLCHSEHMFFWGVSFPLVRMLWECRDEEANHLLEILHRCEVTFEFFAQDCHGKRRYDAITKCGIHLICGEGEEEEEDPLLRLAQIGVPWPALEKFSRNASN